MSTFAKLAIVALVALAVGLLLGFWPLYNALGGDCRPAFIPVDYAGDVCKGMRATMRYPAIALVVVGVAFGIGALYAHANAEKWDPIK